MSNQKRRAFPASEKNERLEPVQKMDTAIPTEGAEESAEESVEYYAPFTKAVAEERIVEGVVLQPDVIDAQGTLIPESVIRKAAHAFLTQYNRKTQLAEQHSNFKEQFELLESAIAPCDLMINNKAVKKGSWYIVVKVKNEDTWKKVKDGSITGFSIGGTARAKRVQSPEGGN